MGDIHVTGLGRPFGVGLTNEATATIQIVAERT
jgi:hypothetical protein